MSAPDFSATRRWWPHFLIDEWMPPGRETPQAWLRPDGNGVTTVPWDEDDPARGGETLAPGETVEFMWHESRGRVDILLMPDGSWSLCDPRDAGTIDMFTGKAAPLPPAAHVEDANWFAASDDYETNMDSMDAFARAYAEFDDLEPEGRRIAVDMGFWSVGEKFRVSADGRSLERVDPSSGADQREAKEDG